MRLQGVFIAVITTLLSIAAADTLQKWTDIASKAKSNVIRLDHETFDQIVATDRNYTAIIQLTALGAQYQCAMCRDFDPEFAVVAQSWRKAHPRSDGVFFATLDFAEGRQIFMRFGIQSAPNLWVYLPTTGPLSKLSSNNQPITYDFPGHGMTAEPFHRFLQKSVQLPPFPIVRPFNWQKLFLVISSIVTFATLTKLAWPTLQKILQNKNVWAAGSLVVILLFTSGHMYNTIRHTPYTQPDGRGGFNYIAGGFQNQLGIETQIVAFLYGLLAFTTMALVLKAPTVQDPTTQSIVIWVWTAGILFVYSFLIYVFRIKNGGYPFRLFL